MLKITNYASQFDLYILKWPKACMSCGTTSLDKMSPKYKTVDTSNVRSSGLAGLGGETKTTVNTMMKMKLYLCKDCNKEIIAFAKIRGKGFDRHEGPAFSLKSNPYGKFVTLDSNGRVWIADSPFLEMMKELNPELIPVKGKHPFAEIRKKIPKGAVIPSVEPEEIDSFQEEVEEKKEEVSSETPPQEDDDELIQLKQNFQENPKDFESVKQLALALAKRNRCKEVGSYLVTAKEQGMDLRKLPDLLKLLKEYCG